MTLFDFVMLAVMAIGFALFCAEPTLKRKYYKGLDQ